MDGENARPTGGDTGIHALLESLMLLPNRAQQRLVELIKKHPEMLESQEAPDGTVESREVGRRMGRSRKLVRAALVAEGEGIRPRSV